MTAKEMVREVKQTWGLKVELTQSGDDWKDVWEKAVLKQEP